MSSLSPKALAVDDASDLDVAKPDAAKAAAPASTRSVNRKEEILQALAAMLEQSPGQRITTAAIANKVGVSEAALYRHFPSKARMFEGLIEFIETTLLGKIEQIIKQHKSAENATEAYCAVTFSFC